MNRPVIDQAFDQAIKERVFSGAQVLVGRGSRREFHRSYGTLNFGKSAPSVTENSLFDVASLTKPVVTTTLFMLAVESEKIKLNDPVKKYLPAFNRTEEITVENLLAHNSGLPDWAPIFEEIYHKEIPYEEVRDFFVQRISDIPLEAKVGEKRIYSDLGFILAGFILEKVESNRLDKLFYEKVSVPLKLLRSHFCPLMETPPIDLKRIVATEECPWRKRLLVGEVHDDNAFVLGGVAGHAGLFSDSKDLEKFIHYVLKIKEGNSSLISQKTYQQFLGDEENLKLGWDMVSLPESQAGKYFSALSIGHLGFTGCSFWLDPTDKKFVILLTNSVHPHRRPEVIKEFRPKIHDLLLETLRMV